MSSRSEPGQVWSDGRRTLIGHGEHLRLDPGTGPDRYRRALEGLRSTGRDLAFVCFTFDPDEEGSVVVVPEEVVSPDDAVISHSTHGPLEGGATVDDGIPDWREGIDLALGALEARAVEKVVLARRVILELSTPVAKATVAERLRISQPGCYTFILDDLVGASPEMLVTLKDGWVESLALAGTATSGRGLESEKMGLEHQLTVESVRDGLESHVTSLETHPQRTRAFGRIHHLATRVAGTARSGTDISDILATLHPTAAVGGVPKDSAVELIRKIEPRPRGWYAGPIGWIDSTGEGELALALRCGLVEDTRVTLFTGGGIVAGSDVEAELAETELKLSPMLQALGLQ